MRQWKVLQVEGAVRRCRSPHSQSAPVPNTNIETHVRLGVAALAFRPLGFG